MSDEGRADGQDDWIDRYADVLGVARLTAGERETLLDLAREVAHATERANAPLATYLAGRAAGGPAAALGAARTAISARDGAAGR